MKNHAPYARQFYRAMQKWIKSGCPEYNKFLFTKRYGLCQNYFFFLRSSAVTYSTLELYDLKKDFRDLKLNPNHPFNATSREYFEETEAKLTYKNSARLVWIKEHAK